LRPDTVLVSIMHVNNEIGVIQDIAALGAICAAHGGARLHVDAAQSVGKIAVDFTNLGVDLMSVSAHKVYGPKGVGALLTSRRGQGTAVHLTALHFGGGQERGLRAGTVPTHQVVGMGLALQLACEAPELEAERIAPLRERLWQGLARIGGVIRNGDAQRSVPQLLNVSFEGVEGESLLASVRGRIAVSTGSACSSASREPSYVLRALGRDDQLCESSLRFGLGRHTTVQDIDTAAATVAAAVSRLRRMNGT
jgi:cysteine desulfurase